MKLFTALAALTLIAAPVNAMDYVKCEAMQKASSRLSVSLRQASNDAMRADMAQQKNEQCGSVNPFDCGYVEDHQRKIAAGDKAALPYQERLTKIRNDYSEAGCY